MAHSAASIANAFIARAFLERVAIDAIKAVRLAYIAHGYQLAISDTPLIADPVDAAPWGADYGAVKLALGRRYGAQPVDGFVPVAPDRFQHDAKMPLSSAEMLLIDTVWAAFGRYEGFQLSALTRPRRTRLQRLASRLRHGRISDSDTKRHFAELLKGAG